MSENLTRSYFVYKEASYRLVFVTENGKTMILHCLSFLVVEDKLRNIHQYLVKSDFLQLINNLLFVCSPELTHQILNFLKICENYLSIKFSKALQAFKKAGFKLPKHPMCLTNQSLLQTVRKRYKTRQERQRRSTWQNSFHQKSSKPCLF